jgi:hypothetical protein
MADQAERRLVAQVEVLEHALGQAGGLEGLGEALGAERRLGRVLEDHRVAGHERRHDGVDRGEVRVVPGRHDEDQAERIAPDEAGEAFFRIGRHVGQGLRRGGDHVARALLEAADLARALADRPAHLPGDLLGDLGLPGDEGVDRLAQQGLALGERHVLPGGLRLARALDRGLDLGVRRQRPFDIDAAVGRRDAFQFVAHDPTALRPMLYLAGL